ncbi:hypothetical protein QRX50_36430 [Amycolatopsis carbonis]|uniref:Uncharacterized protein n=1 Tax=Amycolatopsis carbonis TaxID=715471 RepID=A0A9Y2IEG6_9PSEU|nr:hypothetical protein [Amycolatopsis sp. 2-15]WIX76873.1 hypothetical protein QRX50_36430 [Amycolatopsis sp. 2-15]
MHAVLDGLGEPERDALQRRRERAADRYTRLLSEGKPQGDGKRRWSAAARWTRKVHRARRRANLHDPAQQARAVRVIQHERADDELMNARLPKLVDLPTTPAAPATAGAADRAAVEQPGERPDAWWNAAGRPSNDPDHFANARERDSGADTASFTDLSCGNSDQKWVSRDGSF